MTSPDETTPTSTDANDSAGPPVSGPPISDPPISGPPSVVEDDDAQAGRFGAPGQPLDRRSPFLLGLLGGLGLILAYAIFLGLHNAASILVLIFIALFLAIGLNPAVAQLRRFGVPRDGAVAIVALTLVGWARWWRSRRWPASS